MYIREYNDKDRSACLDLFKSNMPLYFAEHELTDYEQWLDGREARKLAYDNSQAEMYYVLENDGEICACGGFYVSKNQREARMCWGMVGNASHKNGYGTILLEYRIQRIRELFPEVHIA